MSTPEIQHHIDSLPPELVAVSEHFHIKCQQHLARGQAKGRKGWNSASKEELLNLLDQATKDGDWTSVSNYAMMLNHLKAVQEQPAENEHWAASLPAGAVLGL